MHLSQSKTSFQLAAIMLMYLVCSCSPTEKKTEEVIEAAPTIEPAVGSEPEQNVVSYFSEVYDSLDPISPDPEQETTRLLLSSNHWDLLPQGIIELIPEGGRVFLVARATSLSMDRSMLVEIEVGGIYPQFLIALDDNFEVTMHHELFTTLEGEYSVTRHNIWKYGHGDMLSIAIENGPWDYNSVEWELLTLQNNSIEVLESKGLTFDNYESSLAYFELIRDSPVDLEEGPSVVLSELAVEEGEPIDDKPKKDILGAYDRKIPASKGAAIMEELGFEVVSQDVSFYETDQERMLIPLLVVNGTYSPHPDVMLCSGDTSYFFTYEGSERATLVLSREYEGETHYWGVYDDMRNRNEKLSFTADSYMVDGLRLTQEPKLKVEVYKAGEREGWIIKIGDEYFATRQTLKEKFGFMDADIVCG